MKTRSPRRFVRAMSIAGAIALALVGVTAAPALAAPAPVLAGSVQVLDGDGVPIEGAVISLSVGAFGVEHLAVTGVGGSVDLATIPGVDPAGGPYVLWVWANGYAGYWDNQTDPNLTVPVQVVAGGDPLVVNLSATNPPPSATSAGILGTVTDALSGEPIVGIQVAASDDGTGGENQGASQTKVDGSYYLNFGGGSLPSTAAVIFSSIAPSATAPFGYESQFFDGVNASTLLPENPVPVEANAAAVGIDAQLMPNGQLTGTVTEAGAGGIVPLANAQITIWNVQAGAVVAAGFTNDDGTYAFPVPAGNWAVKFEKIVDGNVADTQWYNGATSIETATGVELLAAESTTGIDAQFGTVPLTPVTPIPVLPATGPEDSLPLLWTGLATVLGGALLVTAAFVTSRRRMRSQS